jgi:hypothetical protein
VKKLLSVLFMIMGLTLAAADQPLNDRTFPYQLFKGDFGSHGYQTGLLVTSGTMPAWLAEKASAGDLIVELGYGQKSVGPTFVPSKLEQFLQEMPKGENWAARVLKKDTKETVIAHRNVPVAPNGDIDAGTAAAAIIGGIVVLGAIGESNKRAEYIKRGCREEKHFESRIHNLEFGMVCPSGTREILGMCEKYVWVCDNGK